MSPVPNPFDPRLRNDLSANEKTLLHFMSDCMHGHDMSLVDRYVAEDYIQHTPGIGQGRDGLRHYLEQVASRVRHQMQFLRGFSVAMSMKSTTWRLAGEFV